MEDQTVFRALADPSRRRLLDLLFERDGRALTELESELPMTRFKEGCLSTTTDEYTSPVRPMRQPSNGLVGAA